MDEIDPEIYIKHYVNCKRIRTDTRLKKKMETLDWDEGNPPNEWIWGEPGAGKSRIAREENPERYDKMPHNKWWGGYEDEPVVLIDDLREDHVYQCSNLITWSDRYPFQAEIKSDSTGTYISCN